MESTDKPKPDSSQSRTNSSRSKHSGISPEGVLTFSGYAFLILSAYSLFQATGGYRAILTGSETGSYVSLLISLAVGLVAAWIGYGLLQAAGAASRTVVPTQFEDVVAEMLRASKDRGIDEYIRLSSLSGWIGMFTKLGITGLPLVTIGLTLFFSIAGLVASATAKDPGFYDLAKLTLGAFIGSYVQRQSPDIRPPPPPPSPPHPPGGAATAATAPKAG